MILPKTMINFQYKISLSIRIPNIDSDISPHNIVSLKKFCNYFDDNELSSTYEIQCQLNNSLIQTMKKYKNGITCKLEIVQYVKKVSENEKDYSDYTNPRILISEEFIPYFTSDFLNSTVKEDELSNISHEDYVKASVNDKSGNKQTENFDNKESENNFNMVKIILSSYNFLNMNKIPFNRILTGENSGEISVEDALLSILGTDIVQSGQLPLKDRVKGFLIDDIDNKSNYKDIKIFPTTIINAIKHLHIHYGLYQHGLLLYYDNKVFYVLRKYANKHTREKNQNSSFNVVIQDPNINGSVNYTYFDNSVENEHKPLFYSIMNEPSIVDNEMIRGEQFGDVLVYSNNNTSRNAMTYTEDGIGKEWSYPFIHLNRAVNSHEKSGKRIQIMVDEINNPYLFSTKALEQDMNKNLILNLGNVDIMRIRPNIFINILYGSKNLKYLNGKYMISSAVLSFSKSITEINTSMFNNFFNCNGAFILYDTKIQKNFTDNSFDSIENSKKIINLDNKKRYLQEVANKFFNYEIKPNIDQIENLDLFTETSIKEEIKITKNSKTFNLSDTYYTSQRDNRPLDILESNLEISLRTCNITSIAMAFKYSGYELNDKLQKDFDSKIKIDTAGAKVGGRTVKQLEDYFYKKLISNELKEYVVYYEKNIKNKINEYYNKIDNSFEISYGRDYFMNQLFMDTNIGFKTEYLTVEEIVFKVIKEKKAVSLSGRFPLINKDGKEISIGHIVCLVGIITDQDDIIKITNYEEININEIIGFIIDDPYGDPLSKYTNINGKNVILSFRKFNNWIRNANGKKMSQYFYTK